MGMTSITDNTNRIKTWCSDQLALGYLKDKNKLEVSDEKIVDLFYKKKLKVNPFKFQADNGKIYKIRVCPRGSSCKGAHSKADIRVCDKYVDFYKYDKSKLNLIEYFDKMKNQIIKNSKRIFYDLNKIEFKKLMRDKNLYISQKRIEKVLDSDNFINVLHLWRDLSFLYNIIEKNIRKSRTPMMGYTDSRNVLSFNVSTSVKQEDLLWSLNKHTRACPIYSKTCRKVDTEIKFSLNELCGGDINCKFGYHKVSNSYCIDDILFGKCNCSHMEFYDRLDKIKSRIQILENSNEKNKDSRILSLKNMEKYFKDQISQNKRHLTKEGFIPIIVQLENSKKSEKESTKIDTLINDNKVNKTNKVNKKNVSNI